jgi:hypothetical protein
VRAALVLVLVLAACGGSQPPETPLARVVDHLREHGFAASEVAPRGDPRPEAAVLVRLDGATAAIYAYGSEQDAQAATERFSAEEQAAPARIRVQRERLNVFVGRAPVGEKLPRVQFEDVVFTAVEEH